MSRETGFNYQTIRNWIKQSQSGTIDGGLHDSSPRRLTPKEKYELVVVAAGAGDGNPFIESRFKTMKYDLTYPRAFSSEEAAKNWMGQFVHWYNIDHLYISIGYVTTHQIQHGLATEIFCKRNRTLVFAKKQHPNGGGHDPNEGGKSIRKLCSTPTKT